MRNSFLILFIAFSVTNTLAQTQDWYDISNYTRYYGTGDLFITKTFNENTIYQYSIDIWVDQLIGVAGMYSHKSGYSDWTYVEYSRSVNGNDFYFLRDKIIKNYCFAYYVDSTTGFISGYRLRFCAL